MEFGEHGPFQAHFVDGRLPTAAGIPEGFQRLTDFRNDLDSRQIALIYLSRQSVDMDDLLATTRVPKTSGKLHQVVSHGDHQISVGQPAHLVVAVLKSNGEAGEGIPVAHDPLAHESVGHRYAGLLRKLAQFQRGATADDAVARQDHRSLRFGNEFGRAAHGVLGGPRVLYGSHTQRRCFDRLGGNVLRPFDVSRTGLLAFRYLEGLAHDLRKHFGIGNPCFPFGHRMEQVLRVDVLMRLLVNEG